MVTLKDLYDAVIAGEPTPILKDILLDLGLPKDYHIPDVATAYLSKYEKLIEEWRKITNPIKFYQECIRIKSMDSKFYTFLPTFRWVRNLFTASQGVIYFYALEGKQYLDNLLHVWQTPYPLTTGWTDTPLRQLKVWQDIRKILETNRYQRKLLHRITIKCDNLRWSKRRGPNIKL